MAGCQTPEENAREEMRWANEAVMQKQVQQFKSRLMRLKNNGDNQGIITLWEEFQEWCDANMWPDNWSLWERAAQDAAFTLQMSKDGW
jgi:hypothetical protein